MTKAPPQPNQPPEKNSPDQAPAEPTPPLVVGDYFYKDGGDCWEVYSLYTGDFHGTRPKDVISGARPSPIVTNKSPDDFSAFYKLKLESGEVVYFPRSANLLDVEVFKRELGQEFYFNPLVAEVICQRIAMGEGLSSICKDAGMPSYSVVSRWRREVAGFRQMLSGAYEDRAETLRDKILEMEERIGESTWDKEDATLLQSLRQRFELLKWGAQVDAPGKYSDKLKISGDKDAPLSFVIETGVRRVGDEGFRRDDPQYVKSLEEGEGE